MNKKEKILKNDVLDCLQEYLNLCNLAAAAHPIHIDPERATKVSDNVYDVILLFRDVKVSLKED